MKHPPRIVATFLGLTMIHALQAGEVRTWTDNTGKHKTEAEFVSFDDGIVTLRRQGSGKSVELPLERLSDEDQEYVDDLLRELERQDPREEASPEPSVVTQPKPRVPGSANNRRVPNNVINSVRGAVYRTGTINNMRQIAMAIIQYESGRGRFPAAAILTPDRKPGLSWRVAILPMLEMKGLYRQFRLNEPWDSPHNKAMISRMPSIYKSPGSALDGGLTNYLAIGAPDTIIATGRRGARSQDVRDGLSNTIMFVEADDSYGVVWTKPDDYEWDRSTPTYGLGNIWTGGFFAAFGDGTVKRIEASSGADRINAFFSRNGGELIR